MRTQIATPRSTERNRRQGAADGGRNVVGAGGCGVTVVGLGGGERSLADVADAVRVGGDEVGFGKYELRVSGLVEVVFAVVVRVEAVAALVPSTNSTMAFLRQCLGSQCVGTKDICERRLSMTIPRWYGALIFLAAFLVSVMAYRRRARLTVGLVALYVMEAQSVTALVAALSWVGTTAVMAKS